MCDEALLDDLVELEVRIEDLEKAIKGLVALHKESMEIAARALARYAVMRDGADWDEGGAAGVAQEALGRLFRGREIEATTLLAEESRRLRAQIDGT